MFSLDVSESEVESAREALERQLSAAFDYSDKDCAREQRCDNDADGRVIYEFDDGSLKAYLCQRCATFMHEIYGIDRVLGGDIDLEA